MDSNVYNGMTLEEYKAFSLKRIEKWKYKLNVDNMEEFLLELASDPFFTVERKQRILKKIMKIAAQKYDVTNKAGNMTEYWKLVGLFNKYYR